jgi:hypothetical protein
VVIIRVDEVLIINAAFSTTRLVTFARRGANCCRGRDQLGPLVGLEVNYRGDHVGEGQLMEIKEETIRDWGNLVVVAGWSSN